MFLTKPKSKTLLYDYRNFWKDTILCTHERLQPYRKMIESVIDFMEQRLPDLVEEGTSYFIKEQWNQSNDFTLTIDDEILALYMNHITKQRKKESIAVFIDDPEFPELVYYWYEHPNHITPSYRRQLMIEDENLLSRLQFLSQIVFSYGFLHFSIEKGNYTIHDLLYEEQELFNKIQMYHEKYGVNLPVYIQQEWDIENTNTI